MLCAAIFLICFVLLGILTLWLSKNVEHGEAQFDTRNKADQDQPSDGE